MSKKGKAHHFRRKLIRRKGMLEKEEQPFGSKHNNYLISFQAKMTNGKVVPIQHCSFKKTFYECSSV